VSGLTEAWGQAIVAERQMHGPYSDVDDLAHRAKLPRRALELLARAGAFATIAGHRRTAHWNAIGVESLPGILAGHSAHEPQLPLTAPTEGEDIVADYRGLGLTLGRHPLALLRSKLDRLKAVQSAELTQLRSGLKVRVAGIVTHRQRPETASGVIFMSLEDETGISNLIVWPGVQQAQREAVFGARLMLVEGELQSEMGVIHVIAERMRDYSHWLGRVKADSRDFR
jgi:error-prone DNA polymerase